LDESYLFYLSGRLGNTHFWYISLSFIVVCFVAAGFLLLLFSGLHSLDDILVHDVLAHVRKKIGFRLLLR